MLPTSDVDQSIPRDGAIFAVQVEVEQSTFSVTVIEFVADVPAQGTKLLPLLNTRHTGREVLYDHTQSKTHPRKQSNNDEALYM